MKCFLHLLHHGLFSESGSPTPTSVYCRERTLVPGCFSAVYLLTFHFMGVVVVWQSLLWEEEVYNHFNPFYYQDFCCIYYINLYLL